MTPRSIYANKCHLDHTTLKNTLTNPFRFGILKLESRIYGDSELYATVFYLWIRTGLKRR